MVTLLAVLLISQDPAYTAQRLDTGGRADSFRAEDIDGDGRRDLIVQAGLDLRFFLLRPEGFRAAPDFTVRLDAGTYLWTLAPFCDSERLCVVTVTPRGLHRHPRADGIIAPKAQDLVIHPNIFDGPLSAEQAPIELDFMRDLDGDGLRDAILFMRGAVMLMRQTRDPTGRPQFTLSQRLSIPIDAGLRMLWGPHQQIREVTSVPILAFGDFNGDKRTDIGSYLDEQLNLWYGQGEGRYDAQDPRTVGEKRRRRNTFLRFEVPPTFVDVTGDGLMDIVAVQASKGRADIYLNRDGRIDLSNSDAVLKVEDGWSTGAFIRDLDRDGRSEVIMGIVRKLDVLGGIHAFSSKKVDLELHVFRFDAARGTYSSEPVQILRFSIPFTFSATREGANIDLTFRPTFDADTDGDRLTDLIVERDARSLSIYRGVRGRGFSDQPGAVLRYDPPADAVNVQTFVADFNGDGRSDLVLRYALASRRAEADVLLSR